MDKRVLNIESKQPQGYTWGKLSHAFDTAPVLLGDTKSMS